MFELIASILFPIVLICVIWQVDKKLSFQDEYIPDFTYVEPIAITKTGVPLYLIDNKTLFKTDFSDQEFFHESQLDWEDDYDAI